MKKLKNAGLLICLVSAITLSATAKMPPSIEQCKDEPVKYVGTLQTDKHFFDGALPHVVGVHNYAAFRANRTVAPEGGVIGWTYNHQPYLCYWNGKYYLQYLSTLKQEHEPPSRTLIMTSENGFDWSTPQIVFPEYSLPEIKRGDDYYIPAGMKSVMHQRMGWYIAPDGRLLTCAFYSFCDTPKDSPNDGNGIGRVVSEVYKDGSFGPVYFIRYNRHAGWNESNTNFPFYKQSADKGFVQACEALLTDKLVSLQWWEEDRGEDGFYNVKVSGSPLKALSFCHRPDGTVLALWKRQLSALSSNEGQSWTDIAKSSTLYTTGAKVWGQKTVDGKYAIVYNHSATQRNRFPLCVMTSEDCYEFDNLACISGEMPPQRYQGFHKDLGLQYVRGIVEGNGNPPGDYLWNTYSVNKEDMWVSRTKLPVKTTVDSHIGQDFEGIKQASDLEYWNLYVPKWADISIVDDPAGKSSNCLELREEEPYDYVRAERIIPQSKRLKVEFRVRMELAGHGKLFFEVQDRQGKRPLKLRFDGEWLWMDRGRTEKKPVAISQGKWIDVSLDIDCTKQAYDLYVNGKLAQGQIKFGQEVESVERLVFRTGPWRKAVGPVIVDREPGPGNHSEDLPGSDFKSQLSIYLLDDIKTQGS